jgi:hypothetical protein
MRPCRHNKGQIDTLRTKLLQEEFRGCGEYEELDVWKAPLVLAQHRRKTINQSCRTCAETNRAEPEIIHFPKGHLRGLKIAENPLRARQQHFSRFGHLHTLSHSEKQWAGHLLFQERYMLADRGLGEMQLLSGAAEATAVDGCMEHAKLMQFHRLHRSER